MLECMGSDLSWSKVLGLGFCTSTRELRRTLFSCMLKVSSHYLERLDYYLRFLSFNSFLGISLSINLLILYLFNTSFYYIDILCAA